MFPLLLFFLLLTATFSSPPPPPPVLVLSLTHTLSNATTSSALHLLHLSSLRSSSRRHHHRSLFLSLSPGSDYSLSLPLLSQPISLFLDTASDLVWLPCSPFLCILCESKPPSHPSPFSNLSLPLPCFHSSCSSAHSSLPSPDLCSISGCPLDDIETSSCSPSLFPCPPFYYAYADGSLIAHLRTTHLALHPDLHLPNFTFGCAHSALAESTGVAGFGRGPLSLPAQLARLSPNLGNRFSYCLVSHSFRTHRLRLPSPLVFGGGLPETTNVVYTPMLDDPVHPYYYSVGLEAISVDDRKIESLRNLKAVDANGNGGFVVDSGTTFTMLPREMFERFATEFDTVMRRSGYGREALVEEETGLGPCYNGDVGSGVPRVAMHFVGNAKVRLRRRNYYVVLEREERKVGCLTIMAAAAIASGEEEEEGPAGTMGNVQQQGMEVVFDLEKRRVGFARKSCGEMWGSLARPVGT